MTEKSAALDSPELMYASSEASLTEISQSFPAEMKERFSSSDRSFVLTTFTFPTWNPDSLHWEAPSSLTFDNYGRVYLYAKRIANHRTHGIFNQGRTYTWRVDYQFLDKNKVPMQSDTLMLKTLGFNDSKNDADNEKVDEYLQEHWREIEWYSVTQRIHR